MYILLMCYAIIEECRNSQLLKCCQVLYGSVSRGDIQTARTAKYGFIKGIPFLRRVDCWQLDL